MGNSPKYKNTEFTTNYGIYILDPEQPSIIIKHYELTSFQEEKSFKNLLKMYEKISIPTIIPFQSLDKEKGRLEWSIKWKYFPRTLDNYLNERIKKQAYFSEEEILNMVDCVLSALMAFQFKNLYHNDVRPSRIMMSENDGKTIFMLGLPLLLSSETMEKAYEKEGKCECFLAPQVLRTIKNGKQKSFGIERSDIFSLGMVTLKMATLEENAQFYNLEEGTIDFDLIKKKLYCCRQRYSPELCDFIKNMVEFLPKSRYDFSQTFNRLEVLLVCQEKYKEQNINQSSRRKSDSGYHFFEVESQQFRSMLLVSQEAEQQWEKFRMRKSRNLPMI